MTFILRPNWKTKQGVKFLQWDNRRLYMGKTTLCNKETFQKKKERFTELLTEKEKLKPKVDKFILRSSTPRKTIKKDVVNSLNILDSILVQKPLFRKWIDAFSQCLFMEVDRLIFGDFCKKRYFCGSCHHLSVLFVKDLRN